MICYTFESHHAMSHGFTSHRYVVDKPGWNSVFTGIAIDFSSLLFSQAVDKAYAYVKQSFRGAGSNDAVVVEMFKRAVNGE